MVNGTIQQMRYPVSLIKIIGKLDQLNNIAVQLTLAQMKKSSSRSRIKTSKVHFYEFTRGRKHYILVSPKELKEGDAHLVNPTWKILLNGDLLIGPALTVTDLFQQSQEDDYKIDLTFDELPDIRNDFTDGTAGNRELSGIGTKEVPDLKRCDMELETLKLDKHLNKTLTTWYTRLCI